MGDSSRSAGGDRKSPQAWRGKHGKAAFGETKGGIGQYLRFEGMNGARAMMSSSVLKGRKKVQSAEAATASAKKLYDEACLR